MKKQSQDQTNEQLHIDDAAAAQEEYSLEDIMNEFGGWSKKEEAAPNQQAQTPPEPQSCRRKRRKASQRRPGRPSRASRSAPGRAQSRKPAVPEGEPSASRPSRIPPEEKQKSGLSGESQTQAESDDPKEAKKAAPARQSAR